VQLCKLKFEERFEISGIEAMLQETKVEENKGHYPDRPAQSFVLYRAQMFKLLSYPKPARDQLFIELPCLMGFRNREVCTWRAEWIDFENGNTYVLDAKKKKLFLVPLSMAVAAHVEKVLQGRREGLVLSNATSALSLRVKDKPLSVVSVWVKWKKYVELIGLPNADEISPITGRRFFAAEWFHRQKLPITTLCLIMRHADPVETMRYVQHMVFYEDLRRDFDRFEEGFGSEGQVKKPLEESEAYAPQAI
jgi:integrase